jgi:hypothetical protein
VISALDQRESGPSVDRPVKQRDVLRIPYFVWRIFLRNTKYAIRIWPCKHPSITLHLSQSKTVQCKSEQRNLGRLLLGDGIEAQHSLECVAVQFLLGDQAAQVTELDKLPSARFDGAGQARVALQF